MVLGMECLGEFSLSLGNDSNKLKELPCLVGNPYTANDRKFWQEVTHSIVCMTDVLLCVSLEVSFF